MKNFRRCVKFVVVFAFVFFCAAAKPVTAQTALVAGDIAFSGYIGGFDPLLQPDEFSFVLLRNISTGTVINFTDNGWLNPGNLRSGETSVTWTANSPLSAGQEIRIAGLTAFLASGPGSPGVVTGSALNLVTSGDQILAYQGTTGSPTFISAIQMNVYSLDVFNCANSLAASWDPDCIDGAGGTLGNPNFSKLPAGLTTGANAIWVGVEGLASSEFDNARFTCGSANISNVASARASLNNPANWAKSNSATPGFTLPTGCPYLLVTAANASISGRALTAEGRGISKARISLTDSGGNTRYATTNAFGNYRFDDLPTGETYISQISSKRYQFSQPTQLINLNENISGIDFVALP